MLFYLGAAVPSTSLLSCRYQPVIYRRGADSQACHIRENHDNCGMAVAVVLPLIYIEHQEHFQDNIVCCHLLALPRFRLNTYRCRAFSSCWPFGLKLCPGFYPEPSDQYRLFQTCTRNVFVRSVLVHPAHLGCSTIMRYMNPLTYLLTA